MLVVVQLLSHVWLFATPLTAAHQASLSFTISQSLLKLMFIESVMPSNHLTLCHPLLLLPSIFPSIRVFSNGSVLCIRWPKYWSFSISPSNEYLGLIYWYWLVWSLCSPRDSQESWHTDLNITCFYQKLVICSLDMKEMCSVSRSVVSDSLLPHG